MQIGLIIGSIDALVYSDAAGYFYFPIPPSSRNCMANTVNGERNQYMNVKYVLYTILLLISIEAYDSMRR